MNRIGFIVPSINVTAEDEMIAMGFGRVGMHFARAIVDQATSLEGQFAGMVEQLPRLATGLRHAGVSAIAFACTSASFFRGVGSDVPVRTAITDAARVPAVATAAAVVEALSTLGVRRVAVATPYVAWVYQRERAFLEGHGFEVTAITGLERRGGVDVSGIESAEVCALVDGVDSEDADAIFISCTDLPSAHLIDELEARYGKPVVTSNQATFWACAQQLGVEPFEGFGKLLSGRDFAGRVP